MEKREPSYTVGENANYYSHYGEQCAAAAAKLHQSCPTLCDPRDGSPPGSPVPGILQARTLEWVAISFSKRTVWRFLKKLETELPYDPTIPLLGIHTGETRIERDTCIPGFIAALYNSQIMEAT